MNGGKRVSLPKEPLYEHCNENSLYSQSRHGLKSCGPYVWSAQGELLQEDPSMEGCDALKKRLSYGQMGCVLSSEDKVGYSAQ